MYGGGNFEFLIYTKYMNFVEHYQEIIYIFRNIHNVIKISLFISEIRHLLMLIWFQRSLLIQCPAVVAILNFNQQQLGR